MYIKIKFELNLRVSEILVFNIIFKIIFKIITNTRAKRNQHLFFFVPTIHLLLFIE